MWRRGDIAVRHRSDVTTRDVVCEFSFKQVVAPHSRPWMSIVLFRDREVVGFGTEQIRTPLAKRHRFVAGPLSKELREIVGLQNDLAIEHAGAASDILERQAQLLDDELMQRVGA